MAVIVIPAAWRTAAEIPNGELECAAHTIGDAIEWLVATHPKLEPRVLVEPGRLASWVNLYVGKDNIRDLDGLDTAVPPGSEIVVLPALAGG
ncbi:MoaD/ThiS family protein [Streptosporangium sp. NPDC001681]|uniref:MoaD/ThiS family protein n=1 Tax=Streptosporangium sp. NPDC001681 TaxID=3154395 RepID=UPI003320D3A7